MNNFSKKIYLASLCALTLVVGGVNAMTSNNMSLSANDTYLVSVVENFLTNGKKKDCVKDIVIMYKTYIDTIKSEKLKKTFYKFLSIGESKLKGQKTEKEQVNPITDFNPVTVVEKFLAKLELVTVSEEDNTLLKVTYEKPYNKFCLACKELLEKANKKVKDVKPSKDKKEKKPGSNDSGNTDETDDGWLPY